MKITLFQPGFFIAVHMNHTFIKGLLLFLLIAGQRSLAYNQNLVPNPSFEDLSYCPNDISLICSGIATPWQCGTLGTCDYFHSCATVLWAGVPVSDLGYQLTHTGEAYAGVICRWQTNNYREYLLVQLNAPLVADVWYNVSFYVSLADQSCGIEKIGAYLSVISPYQDINTQLDFIPQVESNGGYITDTKNWVLISGCFQAEGGEKFLTIGNFHPDSETPFTPSCNQNLDYFDHAYYYVDDVGVTVQNNADGFPVDLNGPVKACLSYKIDPALDENYSYSWSDGSHDPTLIVNETGTYTLTVTHGCIVSTDSIDVTILESNSFLLGWNI